MLNNERGKFWYKAGLVPKINKKLEFLSTFTCISFSILLVGSSLFLHFREEKLLASVIICQNASVTVASDIELYACQNVWFQKNEYWNHASLLFETSYE